MEGNINSICKNFEDFDPKKDTLLNKLEKDTQATKNITENQIAQLDEAKCTRRNVQNLDNIEAYEMHETKVEINPIPYTGTKLRPDAPPFLPEKIMNLIKSTKKDEAENDECFFTNVDLGKEIVSMNQENVLNVESSSTRERIFRESGLKPFSLLPLPQVKRSSPKLDNTENQDVVYSIPTVENQSTSSYRKQSTPVPQTNTVRSRYISSEFLLKNRIQIAVLMASTVVCFILLAYILV